MSLKKIEPVRKTKVRSASYRQIKISNRIFVGCRDVGSLYAVCKYLYLQHLNRIRIPLCSMCYDVYTIEYRHRSCVGSAVLYNNERQGD